MKILLVEDDLEISKLLAEFLQENGYEVFCQYDGLHVLDCLRENKIDLILLDIMLATVYKGNIIKNLIMDCQSYTKYRPNETTGGIFVSWRRKEELPTGA